MVQYNEGGSDSDRKEVGQDIELQIDGNSYPITSVNIDEEADTSETQTIDNDLPTKDIAVTGLTYSGSFEMAGNSADPRSVMWRDNGTNGSSLSEPLRVSSMTIIDSKREYNLSTVVIESTSKDMPADDRATRSFDFSAERLVVTQK